VHTKTLPSPFASYGWIGDGKLGPLSHVCKMGPDVPGYYIVPRENLGELIARARRRSPSAGSL